MEGWGVRYLAVVFAVLAILSCRSPLTTDVGNAKPIVDSAVTATGDDYNSELSAWVKNIGIATARNAYIIVTVEPYVDKERVPLGDIDPNERVKFTVELWGCPWGSEIQFGYYFEWDE